MGVAIPLGYVEDRASGALIVDGSLRFTGSSYLKRTPGSTGNTTTYTISCWVKRSHLAPDGSGNTNSNSNPIFSAGTNAGSDTDDLQFYKDAGNNNAIRFLAYPGAFRFDLSTSMVFRDVSSWYHILANYDGTTAKIYINGTQVTAFASSTQNGGAGNINTTDQHVIGASCDGSTSVFRGYISQFYFIDGQALDPSYFGYTDALTNTWRPKKFKPQATPNDGRTWSSSTTGSFVSGRGADKAFNGIVNTTDYAHATTGTTASINNLGITGITRIRLNIAKNNTGDLWGPISLDSTNITSWLQSNYPSYGNTGAWIDVTSQFSSSTLNSISITTQANGTDDIRLAGVEINGVILIDGDKSNIGLNGFYLPFDGSAPIGQDQSGRGNNWTPVNFGGSNTLEKATGALPILNTDGGGKVARVGVRTDSSASSLVLALPLVGIKSDFSNAVNSGTSNKSVTNSGAVASSSYSNLYGGSWYFGGESGDAYSNAYFQFGSQIIPSDSGDFTVEMWVYLPSPWVGTYGSLLLVQGQTGNAGRFSIAINTSKQLSIQIGSSSATTTNSFSLQSWTHLSVIRSSGTIYLAINGVIENKGTISTSPQATTTYFGSAPGWVDDTDFHGYVQDLRVYTTAKYTQNFIPASTDPDILPDTPSGVSYTSNLTQITDGAVAFDGASDYLNLGSSADYNVGTGDFTFECFAYYNTRNDYSGIFGPYTYSNNAILIQISNSSVLRLVNPGGIDVSGTTNISNRWVHIAVSRSGTTLRGFINGIQEISTTYSSSIDFANGGAAVLGVTDVSTYLGTYDFRGFISNVHFVKGTALYTSNFTPPTAPISSVANTKLLCCQSNSNPKLSPVGPNVGLSTSTRFNTNFETIPTTVNGISVTNNGSVSTTSAGTNSFGFTNGANFTGSNSLSVNLGSVPNLTTIDLIFKVNGTVDNKYLFGLSNSGLVRRSSSSLAWYNGDTDQIVSSTPDDGVWHHLRVTPTDLYFDGTRIQNTTSLPNIATNSNGYMAIGAYRNDSGTIQYNGAVIFGLVRVMPGVDLGAPTVPITTNGSLSSSETIPTDGVIIRVGNAAATNFNPFTVNINTQRGKQSGWCTLNPLDIGGGTLSNGNLDHTYNSSNIRVKSTISIPTTGKWYAEFVASNAGGGNSLMGVATAASALTGSNWYLGNDAGSWGLQVGSGTMYTYHNGGFSSFGTANNGDVIAVAVDRAAGKIWWAVNNIWIAGGDPVSGTNARYTNIPSTDGLFFAISNASNSSIACNFGQKPFKFPPPAGFQPLALANTPRPTIVRPDQYVGVTTYTGTASVQSITGVGNFKPDFVWIKDRGVGWNHQLYDSVRGVGANKELTTSQTWKEGDTTNMNTGAYGYVSSLDASGFTLNPGSGGAGQYVNQSTKPYVAWCWKAGGNSNTYNINDVGYATASAAGLTAGTITPTGASVNTKSGFSVVTYTGNGSTAQTIGHGLGVAPGLIIAKRRSAIEDWAVYHGSLGGTKGLSLNNTAAQSTSIQYWSDTNPTSTVFTVHSNTINNGNGSTYVAYCFAPVVGYSSFGSYVAGSGEPFVYLGFKPALVIIKAAVGRDTAYTSWYIADNKRPAYNPENLPLWANKSAQEGLRGNGSGVYSSDLNIDLLSNGFKIRDNNGAPDETNFTGATYIYAAFAETPTQNLYGAQANAR